MLPKEQLKSILAERLGIEVSDIDEESLLAEDLGIDAVAMADILDAIRERTTVEIPADEVKEAQTVEQLANLVEENTLE